MAFLASLYVIQTGVIWSDPTEQPPLQGAALEGARFWHANNCQACHQIYGYGGFIGPDLTNAAARGEPELRRRLDQALSHGPSGMPVIPATPADIDALNAWLAAIDRTGIGQARAPELAPMQERFEAAITAKLAADSEAGRGFGAWRERPCAACHQPLHDAANGAPDLSRATDRLTEAELEAVLTHGRSPRMPAPEPAFTEQERADVAAWLMWLAEHREVLRADLESPALAWADLPWWEYE